VKQASRVYDELKRYHSLLEGTLCVSYMTSSMWITESGESDATDLQRTLLVRTGGYEASLYIILKVSGCGI
jgi:hypothetical protein